MAAKKGDESKYADDEELEAEWKLRASEPDSNSSRAELAVSASCSLSPSFHVNW
jgi:hypothetical protein